MSCFPLVAVDVGNNRTKCGLFMTDRQEPLPEPDQTVVLPAQGAAWDALEGLVGQLAGGGVAWWIGSVNRPAATRLIDWLHHHRPEDSIVLISARDLPLRVGLERPDMVGIDRLVDALAANQLRSPEHAAIVVDVGTAITVDLVSREGVFLGGAIVPGIGMSAQALHQFTDLLPRVDTSELEEPPPALGTSTVAAMRSGLFWGAVGAIRQLIAKLTASQAHPADVFLTGGASPTVAQLLGSNARHVPHLTLAGIALAARDRLVR